MLRWHCDICGKVTTMLPQTEKVFEEVGIEVNIPDKDGKVVSKTVKRKVPKMTVQKQQDPYTGKIINKPVQMIKDLSPRTYIINFSVGQENITKDVCKECLDKHLIQVIQPLWDKLASLDSK